MKTFIKDLAVFGIGAFLLFMVTAASAQVNVGVGAGPGYMGYYPPVRHYYYNPYGNYYGYAYPRIGAAVGVLPNGYMPFYFGANLYYYSNGVYYRQYQDNSYRVVAPPVGAEVPQLPLKARALMINGQQYFERNGVYYKLNIKPDGSHDYLIAGKDGVLSINGAPSAPQPVPMPAPRPQPAPVPQAEPEVQQAPAVAPQSTEPEMQLPPPPVIDTAATTTLPRTGDVVSRLPDGCKAVSVAGKKYFVNSNDVYYEEFNDDGKVSYRVVGIPTLTPVIDTAATTLPKTGDVVSRLPDGCKAVSVAGKKYFVNASDVYYEEFNEDGKTSYRVVGSPADQGNKQ